MNLVDALSLLVVMTLLAAMPSSSVALVVTRSATAGLRHGVAVALGIVLGDLVYVAAALLGLVTLAEALGGLFVLIKLLGGLYLLWLGASLLLDQGETPYPPDEPRPGSPLLTSVLAGLVLTLGDVKAVLFYASLFPQFVQVESANVADALMVTAMTVLAVGGVKLVYAFTAYKLRARVHGSSAGRLVQGGAGGVLIGAGGYVIATAAQ